MAHLPLKPCIGIPEDDLTKSCSLLNTLLADEFVLLMQTLNFHWNLVGREFHDYHLLFDTQYKQIFGYIDDIAERIRSLGGNTHGSLKSMISNARLTETHGPVPTPQDMVAQLLLNHESVIRSLREGVNRTAEDNNDMGTSNFLTDLMEYHEKTAWMLRSLIS